MVRLLWIVPVLLGLPVAGILYQWLGARRDKLRFLRLGTMVDIGQGRQLYLAQTESQTSAAGPTVIFESGIAATSQNWAYMQESVSAFARSISYDRAGLGWSSEAVSERTPSNIVRELRTLLERAGVAPPYILVGHSFGGLVVRRFAAEHPEDVAGVVLVDAMRTSEWPPVNETQRATLERGVRLTGIAVPIARLGLARLATTSLLCRSGRISRVLSRAAGGGGQHVLERVSCEIGKMPREVWPIVAAHWSTPRFYRGLAAHVRAVPATVCEMHEAKPIIGVPVVVLTAGSAEPLSAEALRCIGPEAQQGIAEQSGHWIHLDEPDLVLAAIRDVMGQAARGASAGVESVAATEAFVAHAR